MHVVATAGHVDHGKSTLVRALTGMEPDRLAEERRRGMTIDLGYAWTGLPGGEVVAFVDVPGHERFTSNMLAGVGPVPAVLMVVAADGGWGAQSGEHLAALQALGVRHGVLAVTRSDLADPAPAMADSRRRLSAAGVDAPAVAVSGRTGAGLPALRDALAGLLAALPAPDTGARTRLWVDRVFTVRGAGTVLTGTLGLGRIRVGDTVSLAGRALRVRGLQQMGDDVGQAHAVARVAVNLRGLAGQDARRGDVLVSPDGWRSTCELDTRLVAVSAGDQAPLPRRLTLHVGSAAVQATVRPLAADLVRVRLATPLVLQVGDRGVLRDPGRRQVLAGLLVLDPAPPPLARRGAAAARAAQLAGATVPASVADEVARRGVVRRDLLARIGVSGAAPAGVVEHAGWLVAGPTWRAWAEELAAAVGRGRGGDLLADGLPRAAAAAAAGLPDPALLAPLVATRPDLEEHDGRVRTAGAAPALDPRLAATLAPLLDRLAGDPLAAPEAGELAALGLGPRELGAAAAGGLLLRLPGGVVVGAGAVEHASSVLAGLPAPFTTSAARQALATTRRVALPLLEHLDRVGVTVRVDPTTRRLATPPGT